MTRRHHRLVFCTLAIVVNGWFLFGCVHEWPGITWLPDSSGLVFVADLEMKENQTGSEAATLHLFDLASGTDRVLLADTGTATFRPAVSPDGQSIALAKVDAYPHKPATLTIILLDRQGKERKRTAAFPVAPTPPVAPLSKNGKPVTKKSELGPAWLAWDKNSNKLIVFGMAFGTASYDPATDQLRLFGGNPPVRMGQGAVPPDRKGVLLLDASDKTPDNAVILSLVEWDGTRHPILIHPVPADPEDREKQYLEPLLYLSYFPFSWEGGTALAVGRKGTLRIDTAAGQATFKPRSAAEDPMVDGKPLFLTHTFPDTKQQLRFLGILAEYTDEQGNKQRGEFLEVELFDSARGARKTVLPRIPVLSHIDVAPSGKLVALRGGGKQRNDHIWVVDSHGELRADFAVGKKK
jgi:hypothetical protein